MRPRQAPARLQVRLRSSTISWYKSCIYTVVVCCKSFARGQRKWNHPSIHPYCTEYSVVSILMLPTVPRGRIRYIGCQAIVWRDRRAERLPFVYCRPSLCKPTIAVLILGTTLEHVCCLLLMPKARIVAPRLSDGGCDLMLVIFVATLLKQKPIRSPLPYRALFHIELSSI
jgi:hypothetical protein